MHELLRYTVFGVFVLSTTAALASWAVRTRRISPFTKTAHLIRRTTDPLLNPIENWLLRRGGNPQNAEWWLLGGALVGGILVITVAGWLGNQFALVTWAGQRGPFALIRVALFYAGQIVTIAIFIRVIGSWFGVGPENRLMRPMYILTDWIIQPLRRVIPPIGMIDITPIVAFFLVQIIVRLLTGL